MPVLLARPAFEMSAPRRTVLWCHGFRADALAHAAELEACARAGFLAVGIDAVGHGARRDDTVPARITEAGGALPIMLTQVAQTIAELPALLEVLQTEYHADRTRVSLVGISMGGYLAYGAIAAGVPAVRAVVALLGSPEWPGASSAHLAEYSFREIALLSITAEHDVSVPPAAARRLHAALDTRFGARPTRRHEQLAGAGHLTTPSQWTDAMHRTMDWLERYG